MTYKKFRANIFYVRVPEDAPPGHLPFAAAIRKVAKMPLAKREMYIEPKRRRLEQVKETAGVFLMNFMTFNYPGPGRIETGQKSQSFNLKSNQYFAAETAVLYDPDESVAFIESSPGGMSSGPMAKYLAAFAGGKSVYMMDPVVDEDASARARRFRSIRKIEVRASLGQPGRADRKAGHDVTAALRDLASYKDGFGARVVDIVMHVGPDRKGSLLIAPIQQLVSSVTGSAENDIQRLRVHGRENEEDAIEMIDVLQQRERRERNLLVDPVERKILIDVRWDALLDIHKDFYANVP